jgi:hypothetical protein
MRLSACNVRGLHRSGSHTTVAREFGRYRLGLVGVQEVSWDKGGTVRGGDFNFFMEKETKLVNWGQDFLYTTE